jgi:hypothetical protein
VLTGELARGARGAYGDFEPSGVIHTVTVSLVGGFSRVLHLGARARRVAKL